MNEKLKLIVSIGALLTPVTAFVEKYLFDDWQFIAFLIITITLDTVLSLISHWKNATISSDGFSKIFTKLIVYISLLIITHILTHFTIGGKTIELLSWVDYGVYSTLMVREAISIFEKLAAISPELVPKWILNKLKSIQKQQENES